MFGITCAYTCYTNHHAIDYGFPHGTAIHAAAAGIIEKIQDGLPPAPVCFGGIGYGNYVRILHPNGYKTYYGHLVAGTLAVTEGQEVEEWRDCSPDLPESPCIGNICVVGIGTCARAGTWGCTPDGRAVVCGVSAGDPMPEMCDGLDNDCNGGTDEEWHAGDAIALGQPCDIPWDACGEEATVGVWACTPDGEGMFCDAPRPAEWGEETCDGVDNDCDGAPDNVADEDLEGDAINCGECSRVCIADYPLNRCEGGACFVSCLDIPTQALCEEFCRIKHCQNCGWGCGEGIFNCFNQCTVDPAVVFGDDAAAQTCACEGCQECCCFTVSGFTECYWPCW
ncbi:MAG: M23 family metallopeptidase [bacterium]|nr:M23 family metallopeptidase [bacterium]